MKLGLQFVLVLCFRQVLCCPFFQNRTQTLGRELESSDDDTPCGAKFCYGRLVPLDELPPFNLEFSELVQIGLPNLDPEAFNYMEDSQSRRNVLDGFPLNNDSPSGAAGYTYVGQLLSHDINLDLGSVLGEQVDPSLLPNSNTPGLDLETLYEFGGTSATYDASGERFLIAGPMNRDFPRDSSGKALIADGRNDEHRIVSQLSVAFMALHNKFYDETFAGKNNKFKKAQKETIRTWQSVILTDLLPNLLDNDVLAEVLDPNNRKLYTQGMAEELVMPVEFSTAAYRLFHSRARGRYRMNAATDGSEGNPRARLFDVGNEEPILLGGSELPPDLVIEWNRFFFDIVDGESPSGSNLSRIMDMLYSRPIMRLPIGEDGTPEEVIEILCDDSECVDTCGANQESCLVVDDIVVRDSITASLAILDLVRGQTHSLPGGIAFATYVRDVLGVSDLEVLSLENMLNDNPFGLPNLGLSEYPYTDVPLLLYLAHESIEEQAGEFLGKLGSRIVAEVLYGLVENSKFGILEDGEYDFNSEITGTSSVSMEDVLAYIGWM